MIVERRLTMERQHGRVDADYQPPELIALGTVRGLTEGSAFGNAPDGFLILIKNVVSTSAR